MTTLLAAAAVGLAQPPGTLPAQWSAQWSAQGSAQGSAPTAWWTVIAAGAAWVVALAVVLFRSAPRPRWRAALRKAVLLHLGLLVVALLLTARSERSLRVGPRLDREPVLWPVPDFLAIPAFPFAHPGVLVGIVGVMVVAALLLLGWSAWDVRGRFLRRRGRRLRDPRYGRGPAHAAELETLLEAVGRARAALDDDGEVRRAVIAAYAAFEQALRATGAPRSATQTPAEFVRTAVAARVLHAGEAAEEMLDVFHQARFSHEPMTEEHRDRVLLRLSELHRDLAREAHDAGVPRT